MTVSFNKMLARPVGCSSYESMVSRASFSIRRHARRLNVKFSCNFLGARRRSVVLYVVGVGVSALRPDKFFSWSFDNETSVGTWDRRGRVLDRESGKQVNDRIGRIFADRNIRDL